MNRLFSCANAYLQASDWKDIALLKLCMCALGILIGLAVTKKSSKKVAAAAFGIFIGTLVPQLLKFRHILELDAVE